MNGKADGGKYTTAELADLQKYLETVTDEILSNAWSDDDNVNAEIQNILNSDVANTDGHVAINEVFMFPRDIIGAGPTAQADTIKQLKAVVEKATASHTTPFSIRREDEAMNEFGPGGIRKIMLGGFRHLFALGEGCTNMEGGLPQWYKDHLLDQYCLSFSSCVWFQMTLVDMKQRHQAAKNVKNNIMSSEASLKVIRDIVWDEKFNQRVDAALKDPDGADAKFLFRAFSPIMKLGTSDMDYSPSARSALLQYFRSAVVHTGISNAFLTTSPDSIYDILAQRLIAPDGESAQTVIDALVRAYRGGDDPSLLNIDPYDTSAKHPDAVVSCFIMKFLALHKLLGVDFKLKKTLCLEDRDESCLGGKTKDCATVIEDNSRLSLHYHELLNVFMSPNLVQAAALDPFLNREICAVFDSVYKAQISLHALENTIRRNCPPDNPHYEEAPMRGALSERVLPCPPGYDRNNCQCHIQFQKLVEGVVSLVNIHGYFHTDTCKKYNRGQCRMAYERTPHNGETTMHEIEFKDEVVKNSKGEDVTIQKIVRKEHRPAEPNTHADDEINNLFTHTDGNAIVLSMVRRGFTLVESGDFLDFSKPLDDGTLPCSEFILRHPQRGNSMIVSFSDIYTACCMDNTAMYPMVSGEDAKNAMEYSAKVNGEADVLSYYHFDPLLLCSFDIHFVVNSIL